MDTLGANDQEVDPLIEEFDVKLNNLAEDKSILILQFPMRDIAQPLNARNSQSPLQVRIKPNCGLLEVDVPITVDSCFNREKGVRFGESLRKNRTLQQGGALGLPGGLGSGGVNRSIGTTSGPEISEEELLQGFEEALDSGYVLNKITYGGRILLPKSGEPLMYTAVFREGKMHLTKVRAIVSLQPTLHHLDASTDNEKAATRAQRDADDPPKKSEAQAVNMSAKSADDNEEMDKTDFGKKLRGIQDEPWQHLSWVDEDDERAWYSYEELFLNEGLPSIPLHSAMRKGQLLKAVAPNVDPNFNYESDADWTDEEDSESIDQKLTNKSQVGRNHGDNSQMILD